MLCRFNLTIDLFAYIFRVAKVMINALSEDGGYVEWGNNVPSTGGLYIMPVEVKGTDINMVCAQDKSQQG